jgi:hypothetical protein
MAIKIKLPCGKTALISNKDRYLAKKSWRWSQGYVVCKEKQENKYVVLRLHCEVNKEAGRTNTYFKDGDPLNCQRSNLTANYTNRPGKKTGRRKGDPANDGGWASRRVSKDDSK